MPLPHPSTQPFDHQTSFETANMVGIILSNIAYGFHVAIFMFLIRLHCLRPPRKALRRTRQNWSLIAYAIPLFSLATIGFCLQTTLNHGGFILHRDYPNGPLAYIAGTSTDSLSLSTTAVYVALNWYADAMTLYRFYQVFSDTPWAKVASIAMLFSLVGLGVPSMLHIGQLMENMWTNTTMSLTLAYLGLSLSINVGLTAAVVLRLLWFIHSFRRFYDNQKNTTFTWTVYLIVESSLPYTIVALLTVVACGSNSPMKNALLPLLGQVQAIPPLLLMVGVKLNRIFADADFPPSPAQTVLHFVSNPTMSESSTATIDTGVLDATKVEPLLSPPKPCLSPRSSMIYEIKARVPSISTPSDFSSSSVSLQDKPQMWSSSNNDWPWGRRDSRTSSDTSRCSWGSRANLC